MSLIGTSATSPCRSESSATGGISGHTLEDIGEPLFDHLVGAATIPSHSGKPTLRRPSSYLA
jgi:hypothetical protein